MILPYREMAKRILEKVDLNATSNTTQLNKVLDWINVRYDRILRIYPWDALIRQYTFALSASITDYALQRDVEEIIKIVDITNGRDLREISEGEYQEYIAPTEQVSGNETVGNPFGYRRSNILTCKELMSTGDTIDVLSSDVNDLTPNAVRICGLVSGVEVCENVTLTGTTAAVSTNTYDADSPLRISVSTTDGTDKSVVGNITVRETTDTSKVKSIIAPQDFSTEYQWISFFPQPPTTSLPTVKVTYRRRINRLVNAMDIPIIDCCNEIMQGAYSDMLRNDGDPRAQSEEAKFEIMVLELMKRYETNPNYVMQFKGPEGRRTANRGFLGNVAYAGVS